MENSDLLKGLNKEQKEAVLYKAGPLLILAGAGSGKTKVLTSKITYLIKHENISEMSILAFTFTNKAAKEMKERISQSLEKNVDHMWIGTFHSICSRILRRNISKIGYKENFTIYDTQDSKSLVKSIMKDLKIDEKLMPAGQIVSRISDYRNRFIGWEEVLEKSFYEREKALGEIYREYEKRKKQNNSLDFDDLILKTLKLLEKDRETREYYGNIFKYVFVDEYQDTNKSQYELIKLLSYKHQNICVVGDIDQSIYSWRGADISNILNFEKDFKNAKTILLEQNYRSTSKILNAANQLIKNNEERREKNLWTENKDGKDIYFRLSNTEYEEADDVLNKIFRMRNDGIDFKDMAILYRTNSQSRIFEEKLMAERIPHKVVGGLKFYDRKEVKDLLAYLSFIANPDDDLSLKRIINTPKRGIGDVSVNKLDLFSKSKGQSIYEAIYDTEVETILPKGSLSKIRKFADELSQIITEIDDYKLLDLVRDVYEKSGYYKMLDESTAIEDKSRMENISSLMNAIGEFESRYPDSNLYDYLANVSLLSDVDKTEDQEGISLMTIHAAKGLEYDVIFLTGMEDGLFPSQRTVEEGGLEEERRLCYVALTRAKKQLFISAASSRMVYGQSSYSKKSRFVDEIEGYFVNESKEREEAFNAEYNFLESRRNLFKDRLKKKEKVINKSYDTNYTIGDKVIHKRFGQGMVVSIGKGDDGDELVVSFNNKGIKRLNAQLAPLKKI